MPRLLIVSNRLPVSIERKGNQLRVKPSVGGLATGLKSLRKSYNSLWVGWPGITSREDGEQRKIEKKLKKEFNCYPIFLSKKDQENYYYGFSNKTIWPLFHYFTQYAVYDKKLWGAYNRVNELFCDKIVKIAKEDDLIWIHDYHLMLLPELIRKRLPNATIGFFLHIPFPSSEIFRLLPWRKRILRGLLGSDMIGFHTYDYVQHFLLSVHHLLGYDHTLDQIKVGNRVIRADVFPMGIDYERFSQATEEEKVKQKISKFKKKLGDKKVILSIDRLDYTKGILQRLEAFSFFLKRNPHYKKNVTLILVAVPSRTKVEHYGKLKKQIDELVGKINGKYGKIGWTPIWYMYRSLPFSTLVALYSLSDVALITPLRDGMNLIAKEYIATKKDGKGVLILSEFAGTARELGEAIIINANNKEEIGEALRRALTMPEEEQEERNRVMQKRLKRYNITKWAGEFINRLQETKKFQQKMGARILIFDLRESLLNHFRKSKKRLLLLDYDGTLVPFSGEPQEARPGPMLLNLLKKFSENPRNEVVIISGRDRKTMDEWFEDLKINYIAEHGVWIKKKFQEWKMTEPLKSGWKKKIWPILELYVDRTPGSFIEEKEFSLVWHYRKTGPGLGEVRARELIDTLINVTSNLNLQVLEGNKVIEIKNSGVNKGKAALKWIARGKWDFILAAGDDQTDEDVFAVLPKDAYSIKVGLDPSRARFNLYSQENVILLLEELISRG